ncbi:MAG: EVE domain-containing protein [Vampirovibrionales bacterium]|nr:EVE domain-containing protein [Vampirovibrionales bacterium]
MSNLESPEPQYWLTVGSRENFEISRARGFNLLGIKSTHRKKAAQIRPGDGVLYYLTGLMVLAGGVSVQSEMFEDETQVWTCSSVKNGKPEVYPYRFHIKPTLIAPSESGFLPVREIREQLAYLRKWPEKNWTLGFQGNLHLWPESDFRLAYAALTERLQRS